jgi:hypothetical protein
LLPCGEGSWKDWSSAERGLSGCMRHLTALRRPLDLLISNKWKMQVTEDKLWFNQSDESNVPGGRQKPTGAGKSHCNFTQKPKKN